MEEILYYIQKIAVAVVAVPVYVYLLVSVYPRLIMRLTEVRGRRPIEASCGDRGRRRVLFPEGRGTVYEPAPAVRRYMPAYALFVREGATYMRCRIHPRIAYIGYDVLAFDRRGRLMDAVRVSERITAEGYTRAVRLPTNTAYARVILRQVDGVYTGKEKAVAYAPVGVAVYAGLTVLTTVVVGWLLYDGLNTVMSDLLPFAQRMSAISALLIAFLVGALTAAGMLGLFYMHTKRVLNK